jgi:hypothetical protein
MKRKSTQLIILSLVFLLFQSCKDIDNTLTTNFGVTLNLQFENVDQAEYEGVAIADAGADRDFRNNREKIKSVEIDKITYRILAPVVEVPSDTMEYAAIYFTDGTDSFEPVLITEVRQPVLIKRMAIEQQLILNNAEKERLINLFKKSPYTAKFYYRAQFNKGSKQPPFGFVIHFKVYLDIKAGI